MATVQAWAGLVGSLPDDGTSRFRSHHLRGEPGVKAVVLAAAFGVLVSVAPPALGCPGCPTGAEVWRVVLADGAMTRVGPLLLPFVVTGALAALALRRRSAPS